MLPGWQAVVFALLVAADRISADCPPFSPDPRTTICYPELVAGKPVPDKTNCITTCRYEYTVWSG